MNHDILKALQKEPSMFFVHAIGKHIFPRILLPPKVSFFRVFSILTFSYLAQVVYDMTTFFV